jgi:hypothetical protein
VASPFLESAFLAACPGLRESWTAVRRTHPAAPAASDDDLLGAVRLHVVGLLAAGRVVEFTRFARAVERLMADADPVLDELLRGRLLRPLARDVADAEIPSTFVAPYLGPRTRLAWSPHA